jgi:hypothetical protein
VKVRPAIVIVPVRGGPELAATEYWTTPLQQLLLNVMVIQSSLLVADQVQFGLETETEPLPPVVEKDWLSGEMLGGGPGDPEFDTALTLLPPFGSGASDSAVTVLTIEAPPGGMLQFTVTKRLASTDSPGARANPLKVTVLPTALHERGLEKQLFKVVNGESSSVNTKEETASGPLLVKVIV